MKDGWSFLYVEHVRIERENHAIVFVEESGETPVPVASLSVLMLGPGTSITHAAIVALADNGCSTVWCGEKGVRFYASGLGETRRAGNILAQARAWADERVRLAVVRRMYALRFGQGDLPESFTIAQARGREGARVREAYAKASRLSGIPWKGRSYDGAWNGADPLNRALSSANACLYGVCHAAIVAAGFSPAIGFVHTGRALAFVYDVADLYKIEVTVPLAFRVTGESRNEKDFDGVVRRACREGLHAARLLERIVPDIQHVLGDAREIERAEEERIRLWDPDGDVDGAQNFGDLEEDEPHS